MKATYQHCTMYGSHNIPCTVVYSRVWLKDDMTSIERDFGKKNITEKQYYIWYYDSLEDDIIGKWVNDCYVTLEEE